MPETRPANDRPAGADAFPLAPFLASLETDGLRLTLRDYQRITLALRAGGPWTVAQLRHVLLALSVREAEHEDLFLRRFDQFFPPRALERLDAPEVERTLAELSRGERASEDAGPPAPKPGRRVKPLWIAVAVVVAVAVGIGIWRLLPEPAVDVPVPPPRDTTTAPTPDTEERYLSGVPDVVSEKPISAVRSAEWIPPAMITGILLLALVTYGRYIWRGSRPPRDDPLLLDPELPRYFDAGKIGGEPAPRLNGGTLDLLADSLGYFQSEEPTRRLDVAASVAATGRNGGLLHLVFERRRQVRQVVLLEDAYAESLAWNRIAEELAAGLARRGIPVLHGRFPGVPDRFRTADGKEIHLEDLEDERHGQLLLVFSDAKSLRRGRDRFALDVLSHWPMVAWMEPREPRAWDESTAVPARFGLPIYPATRAGLLQALGRFLTERAPQDEFPPIRTWHGLPPRAPRMELAVHVERLLGDALTWGQAAAMTMTPISFGLADALRRCFHPELPLERLERLAALPGTTLRNDGLRFAAPVLAVLRRGFAVRRERREQEEVLEFVLERFREAEPADKSSAEHHAWEWRYERLRLELDPEVALRRLSALARGPLGEAIRCEMEGAAVLPAEKGSSAPSSSETAAIVPLRVKPRSRPALQRLFALSESSGIRRKEAFPVGRAHWTVLGTSTLFFLAALSITVANYLTVLLPVVVEPTGDVAVRLEELHEDGWQAIGDVIHLNGSEPTQLDFMTPGREYRVSFLRKGLFSSPHPITAEKFGTSLTLGLTRLRCVSKYPEIGLYVKRCRSDTDNKVEERDAAWSQRLEKAVPQGRILSVGLYIDGEKETRATPDVTADFLSYDLSATGSIDILYDIRAGESEADLAEAMTRFAEELAPWRERSQLIWWTSDVDPTSVPRRTLDRFDRTVFLGNGRDLAGLRGASSPFAAKAEGPVTETELVEALPYAKTSGRGAPIVLVRATTEPLFFPPEQELPAAPSAARQIRDIAFEQTAEGTRVTILLDGQLSGSGYMHNELGYDALKEQIVLLGLIQPFRSPIDVGTRELDRIRTGTFGNRLTLVFDFSSGGMAIRDIRHLGDHLEITVQRRLD